MPTNYRVTRAADVEYQQSQSAAELGYLEQTVDANGNVIRKVDLTGAQVVGGPPSGTYVPVNKTSPMFIARSVVDSHCQGGTRTALTRPANTQIYVPFILDNPEQITRVLTEVVAQSGNCDWGIYDSTGVGNQPGARLVSTGSAACPAVGGVAVTITTQDLPSGLYYAAWGVDNGTAAITFLASATKTPAAFPGFFQGSGYPLPATAPTMTGDTAGNFVCLYGARA